MRRRCGAWTLGLAAALVAGAAPALALTLALALAATPVAADDAPPAPSAVVALSPGAGPGGTLVAVSGHGCAGSPAGAVLVQWEGAAGATALALDGPDGRFQGIVRVPPTARGHDGAGFSVSCLGSSGEVLGRSAFATFDVTALPATTAEAGVIAAFALVVAALALLMTFGYRADP